ncbi:hypothetical protein H4R35_000899 [Dimargaris xerosporica]|nr:hypothetical protein H4R35_000899 [Dimargaris xerosporica]
MFSLKHKRRPFDRMFGEFRQDLAKLYAFTGIDSVSGMAMIQLVYDLCTARPRPFVEQTFNAIAQYLEDLTARMLVQIVQCDDVLRAYCHHWQQFHTASIYTDAICIYLNKQLQKLTTMGAEADPSLSPSPVGTGSSGLGVYVDQSVHSVAAGPSSHRGLPPFPVSLSGTGYRPQGILALAHHIWRRQILEPMRDHYQNVLSQQAFAIIDANREGSVVQDTLVQQYSESLVAVDHHTHSSLQWYTLEFKNPYVSRLQQFCQRRGGELFNTRSIQAFMEHVTQLLLNEVDNWAKYCHASSRAEIVLTSEQCLILPYLAAIQQEMDRAIAQEDFHSCRLAYRLLRCIPDGTQPALHSYEQYVVQCGREIKRGLVSTDFRHLKGIVEGWLTLHAKHTATCADVFANDAAFIAALDKAFRTVVNENVVTIFPKSSANTSSTSTSPPSRTSSPITHPSVPDALRQLDRSLDSLNLSTPDSNPNLNRTPSATKPTRSLYTPELLAKYCDFILLRRNLKGGGSEDDVERRASKIVNLFKYVDDKDVFQKFYSRFLAKRLIHNLTISLETEATIVTQLKSMCGIEYTGNLQQMFHDMAVSKTFSQEYQAWVAQPNTPDPSSSKDQLKSQALILSARSWPLPSHQHDTFTLPTGLSRSQQQLEELYGQKHNGRKLTWLWQFGRVDVKLLYLNRLYEVNMSLYQWAVLSLFDDTPDSCTKTISALGKATGLTSAELMLAVRALVASDLLLVPTSELPWNELTPVQLNTQYTGRRYKIRIASSSIAGTTADPTTTAGQDTADTVTRSVLEDRRLYLQSVIVRIMKTRRRLNHAQLVHQVVQIAQTRFAPNIVAIKKCIEQLLHKEYIARADDNRDVYLYIA